MKAIETALPISTPAPAPSPSGLLLAQAETDLDALEPASVDLNRLVPLDRRAILASYGRLTITAERINA